MSSTLPPLTVTRFWWRWLVTASIGIMLFGISLVLEPHLIEEAFSYLIYASPGRISEFGSNAVAYIALIHAILGAVMFGWGAMLLCVVLGPLKRGSREAWRMIVVSLACWFCADTAFSIWSGFWQNAVLNLAILVVFAIPLASIYRGTANRQTEGSNN